MSIFISLVVIGVLYMVYNFHFKCLHLIPSPYDNLPCIIIFVYLLDSVWKFGIKMLHSQEYNIKVMIDGIALEYGIN